MITYWLDSSSWIHGEVHVGERIEYHRDHRDGYILYDNSCTRSRVTTYKLDSSSWIHRAMHVEERIEYHSDHKRLYSMQAPAQGV